MRLVISVSIDIIEYVIPILLLPLIGDLFDVVAIAVSLYLYRWIGLISILELVPGLDLLPTNTLTWFAWFIIKRQKELTDRLIGEM